VKKLQKSRKAEILKSGGKLNKEVYEKHGKANN
jgi:hypothetical protein